MIRVSLRQWMVDGILKIADNFVWAMGGAWYAGKGLDRTLGLQRSNPI
jgi:hypothetical protein